MAINFDSLPTSIDGGFGAIIPKGTYFATIERAEMKTPKDTTKPDYLNLMLKIKDIQGKDMGIVWDIISESTNQYAQYKLRRFVVALGIEIVPGLVIDLKDLAKIATGVKMIVDINQDKENKNQVDIFSGDIYYHISEANKIFGTEDLFVNATDAEDNAIFGDTNTDENIEY
jgi:hypothetical protein